MYRYLAFQMIIDSELAFPELSPVTRDSKPAEILIRYGAVNPQGLAKPCRQYRHVQGNTKELWLDIPDVARFLMTNGISITIDPKVGIDEASLRVFLLGSCFAALLIQRGLLLLHGSTVQIGQRAVTFVGSSGQGKSTLAAAFFKHGYAILSDDVCAINAEGFVIPGFPQIKLWIDTIKQLGFETRALRRVRPQIEKYGILLGSQFCNHLLPLHNVYVLNHHDACDVHIIDWSGLKKIALLQEQTFRPVFVKALAKEFQYGIQYGQLAKRIQVASVTRPERGYPLDDLVGTIESDLKQGIEKFIRI